MTSSVDGICMLNVNLEFAKKHQQQAVFVFQRDRWRNSRPLMFTTNFGAEQKM